MSSTIRSITSSICRVMHLSACDKNSTGYPVPRTGLCTVMQSLQPHGNCAGAGMRYMPRPTRASLARARAASSSAQTCQQRLCTLRTIVFGGLGDGGLDYVFFRLGYTINGNIRVATVTSRASSYCQCIYHAER